MKSIVILFSILLIFICCSTKEQNMLVLKKEFIENMSKEKFNTIKNEISAKEAISFCVKDQNDLIKTDKNILFADRCILEINDSEDTIYLLEDSKRFTQYVFDDRDKSPFAILIYPSSLYSYQELAIDKNVFLRKRLYPEIEVSGYTTEYYYVTEDVSEDLLLNKRQPVFVDSIYNEKYLQLKDKGLLKGNVLLSEHTYLEDIRPYLAQVVFRRED